jgi:hypothetical protein
LKIIIPVQFTQIPNCTLRARDMGLNLQRTDNKENLIFLICKEVQNGVVAKSYEEMRKYLTIYEEAVSHI